MLTGANKNYVLDLITLAEIKAHLGISGSDDDDTLEILIDEVSDDFQSHCNRHFACPGTCLCWERIDIREEDINIIQLDCYPISSVIALCQTDKVASVAYLETDYWIYEELGQIELNSGSFPKGKQIIDIGYYGGFDSEVPPRLKTAAKEEIAERFYEEDSALNREKMGDYSYTKAKRITRGSRQIFSPRVTRILDDFRNIPL